MTESRGELARERRVLAEARGDELSELRRRLASGEPPDEDEMRTAAERAVRAAGLAEAAHEHSRRAHRRAADAHRSAATVAEEQGRDDKAGEHRRAAEADDASAGIAENG